MMLTNSRILPYSVELDCKIKVEQDTKQGNVHEIKVKNGLMIQSCWSMIKTTYLIDYTGKKKPLELWIEHPMLQYVIYD
jgi:hypothetical protein